MKSGMKESDREGVANHSGPKPCEGGREAALEALGRCICGLGIELRNTCSRMLMGSDAQKATRPSAIDRERLAILRSQRPQARRETSCARTERPRCRPRARKRTGGRTR